MSVSAEASVHLLRPEPLPPANPPVRFGILGLAGIAERRWVPALRETQGAMLAAVASRDADKARAKAREWGCEARDSYESLLADPDIEAIYIPLPNSLHAEWCEKALQAGKMVLCEKSLTATPEDLERVRRAVRETEGWLEETFQYRHHPLTDWAAERVRSGRLGALRSGEATFCFEMPRGNNIRWEATLGGGAAFDLGGYCAGVLRLLTHQEPIAARAQNWTWHPSPSGPVDEDLAGELFFASGLVCRVAFSFARPFQAGWTLEGENETLRSRSDFAYNVHDERPFQELILESQAMGGDAFESRGGCQKIRVPNAINAYEAMIEDSCRRWRGGLPPRWGAEDAAKNLSVLWTLLESARRGGERLEINPPAAVS